MNALLTLSLVSALLPADSVMWQMPSLAWENPAVRQWMLPQSHSEIRAGYIREKFNEPIDMQRGTGESFWKAGAETYMKHRSSTLWGDASYTNGRQYDIRWNETSDIDLIYPYVTADSVGGDMNFERYRFAGGYADRSDRWVWGASASYDAGLYYRNVDPRPRNVTGLLELSAGAGYRIFGDYFVSLSATYNKYKQSCDIDFKSEVGVEKIFHLTGLGTHYYRFAGLGLSSYYDGNRFSGVVSLYPSKGSGLSLTAKASRFAFKKVLTELNKLPLVSAWHNDFALQAAWLAPGRTHDWALSAEFNAYRRHGKENVFGDPSSSIYPQIASLDMYADNSQNATLSGLWQFHPAKGGMILWVKASGSYIHRAEAYSQPRRRMAADNLRLSLNARLTALLARGWSVTAHGGVVADNAFNSSLNLAEASSHQPAGVPGIETHRFRFLSSSSHGFDCGIGLRHKLSGRFLLALDSRYARHNYTEGVHSDSFDLSLSLHF